MSSNDAAQLKLQAYLRQVRHGLAGLPPEEVKEILDELRSHVIDRAGASFDVAAVDAAISGLGPARELSGLYLAERMAERVEANRSPWLILKTAWRLAGVSVAGVVLFFGSLIGYVMGAGFVVIAFLKPFMPRRVGFWVSHDAHGHLTDLSIGATDHPIGPDILGWWMIPFGLVTGVLVLFLTWRFGLFMVRRIGRTSAKIASRKG